MERKELRVGIDSRRPTLPGWKRVSWTRYRQLKGNIKGGHT